MSSKKLLTISEIQELTKTESFTQDRLDASVKALTKMLKSTLQNQQIQKQLDQATLVLVCSLSSSIIKGTILTDKHGFLIANVKSLPGVSPLRLQLLNESLAKAVKEIKDNTNKEPLSNTEEAAILSVDAQIVEVTPNKDEVITIDKEEGTITMSVKSTGKSISKTIKDFKTKSWREIATSIIDIIKQGFTKMYESTKKVVDVTIVNPIKNLFNRFNKVKEAQPT